VVSVIYAFNGLLALAIFIFRARDRSAQAQSGEGFRVPWHPVSTAAYMSPFRMTKRIARSAIFTAAKASTRSKKAEQRWLRCVSSAREASQRRLRSCSSIRQHR
jgi:hypothetical protein